MHITTHSSDDGGGNLVTTILIEVKRDTVVMFIKSHIMKCNHENAQILDILRAIVFFEIVSSIFVQNLKLNTLWKQYYILLVFGSS